ncbi:hypothetical protein SAMN05443253_107314 [Bacillus sp. OK048]|nr:hypothetical protein SAMN05443253_107314 [Bacillus sp. OK048]
MACTFISMDCALFMYALLNDLPLSVPGSKVGRPLTTFYLRALPLSLLWELTIKFSNIGS